MRRAALGADAAAAVGQAPAAPTSLTLVGAAKQGLSFNFIDNSSNETSFIVERLDATGNYTAIATVNATAGTGWRNWTDWGLAAGTTYYYRIKARNAGGDSAYTTATGTTTWW